MSAPDLASVERLANSLGVELNIELRGDDDIILGWIRRRRYRRKGVGSIVLDALIEVADESGCTISLAVDSTNSSRGVAKLVSYYDAHGFELDDLSDPEGPSMTYFPYRKEADG